MLKGALKEEQLRQEEKPLPPVISLQHPLLRKYNIMLVGKGKIVKVFSFIYGEQAMKGKLGLRDNKLSFDTIILCTLG